MHVGCGVYEHHVKGRQYLYFWHYETTGGRRVQVKEYIGPFESPACRREALRRCEAYFRTAHREMDRMQNALTALLRSRKA